jgi:hypothetical protein
LSQMIMALVYPLVLGLDRLETRHSCVPTAPFHI